VSETRQALAGERDYVLTSLADLEREHAAGDVDDVDYATLRAEYVTRAAALLRRLADLDEHAGSVSKPAAEHRTPRGRRRLRRALGRRGTRRVLIGVGCVCLAGAASVLALSLAGIRLPGQTETGTISLPESEQITQELDDASLLGTSGEVLQAEQVYEQVLASDPDQPEALAYLGWLDRLTGRAHHDEALVQAGDASIARAVAVAPTYPDARAFYGIALLQDRHDVAGGLAELRAFLGDRPPADLLDGLGPSLVTTFEDEHAAVPAELRPFERDVSRTTPTAR